jgi:hypothetical protein
MVSRDKFRLTVSPIEQADLGLNVGCGLWAETQNQRPYTFSLVVIVWILKPQDTIRSRSQLR